MTSHRLLTPSPDHEPLRVRLYVRQIGEGWATTLLVADDKTGRSADITVISTRVCEQWGTRPFL
jgi:hypothetical protein